VNFAGNGRKEKALRYRGAVAASVTQATVVLTFGAARWLIIWWAVLSITKFTATSKGIGGEPDKKVI
jgi:hypothetical protein